jgi:hypothetical protein
VTPSDFEPFVEDGDSVEHVFDVRLQGPDLAILDELAEATGARTDAVIACALRSLAAQRRALRAADGMSAFADRLPAVPVAAPVNAEASRVDPWKAARELLAGV